MGQLKPKDNPLFGVTWGPSWEFLKSQFHPSLVISWEVVPITQSGVLVWELYNTQDSPKLDLNWCQGKPSLDSLGINKLFLCKTESKFWLQKINYRLTGKPSIKTPYKCEIQRNIPVELFHCLQRALQCSRTKNLTDHVTYEVGQNHSAMLFVSKEAVVVFLSLLSGLEESDIKKYFKKYLSGRVSGKVTITVNTGKKFEFIYKKKSSQLCNFFHYGVWNKAGFPLYNWK